MGDAPLLPAVSIIVPVFNAEKRIGLLLESLFCQDYPKDRFEVLAVDNGSTDGTRTVIEKYPVVYLEETQNHELRRFFPTDLSFLRKRIREKGDEKMNEKFIGICIAGSMAHLAFTLGIFLTFLCSLRSVTPVTPKS